MTDPLLRALSLLDLPRKRITAAVGAGVIALGSALALAALAAWLIARAWQMPPVLDLSVAVVSVRALGITRGLFRYLERLASHDTAFRGTTSARAEIYRKLAVGDAAAVTRLRRGDLLTRTGDDVDTVGAVVVRALVPMAVAAVLSVAAVVLLGMISWAATGVLAVALVVAGVVAPMFSARAARAAEAAAMTASATYAENAVTVLDHAAELRVAGRSDVVIEAAKAASNRAAHESDRAAGGAAFAAAATPLGIGVSVLASLMIGILLADNGMSPMSLAVLVLLPLAAFEAVGPMPAAAQALTRGRVAAGRIMELVDKATAAGRDGVVPVVGVDIETLDVCAGWPGGTATRPQNMTVPPGGRVAIVGPSGSGKTTLLMTLAGLLPPTAGWVNVGGIDVTELDPAELRQRVTFFAEDAHLFETSLLENLRVARGDLNEVDAVAALRAVGLRDWVDALPDGVDTVLVGGDRAVSGGQRRRILLARALVAPADVLLLDEPTEHLDAAAGAELLRALLDRDSGLLGADRSVVVVTHQLPTDTRADQVISLNYAQRENLLPTP
ncbi:thiol reductant ABC exporter subunit CydC [Antrihabitans cavernicola]|uniref:Thiol reductant ABC exporter subunit CydC n=1 Tax=Antrihabitans cavernicola TaxID=2495913 RepID=A0A5A7S9E0_9NOCA|nr:thiol reductant ABC exporter subunit CydC [Spelaeibacter cavernicola]KAA0021859.1 thiol reductant ABC exporter subunit CydC [Spelaeibacter cavernicola]